MYRRDETTILYRAVARDVWERYRPRGLDIGTGLGLLRDPDVPLSVKALAAGASLMGVAILLALQSLVVRWSGAPFHITSAGGMLAEALAGMAILTPAVVARLAEPEDVIRVRLKRLAVIPLRRR